MTHKLRSPLQLQGVPHVAVEIIVAGEQDPAGLAERNRGDTTDNVLAAEASHLLIGPDIKHSAGRVVASGCKVLSVGHEGDSVDVELVSEEGLVAHSVSDIPQFGGRITGAWEVGC